MPLFQSDPTHCGELLNGIVGETTDQIAVIDAEYRFIGFNEAYRREFEARFARAPALGDSFLDLVSDRVPMSALKSQIGHAQGASGAAAVAATLAAMEHGQIPPTLNLDNPSVNSAIDLVPHQAKRRSIDTVLSNSFGFGGTNASLIIKAFTG